MIPLLLLLLLIAVVLYGYALHLCRDDESSAS